MPSVKVRRRAYSHSQYGTLLEEGGNDASQAPHNDSTTRPRSRTLASLFMASQTDPSNRGEGARRQQQNARRPSETSGPSATNARTAPLGRVAHSIRKTGSYVRPPLRMGSLDPTASTAAGNQGDQDRMVLLHGSQLDVAVHSNDLAGVMGSSLSLASHISSMLSLDDEHHEDDIVEHLDVIGE